MTRDEDTGKKIESNSRSFFQSLRAIALAGAAAVGAIWMAGCAVAIFFAPEASLSIANADRIAISLTFCLAALGMGIASIAFAHANTPSGVLLVLVSVVAAFSIETILDRVRALADPSVLQSGLMFAGLVVVSGVVLAIITKKRALPRLHIAVTSAPSEQGSRKPEPQGNGRTAYCDSCNSEVGVDEDERCVRCRWPVEVE